MKCPNCEKNTKTTDYCEHCGVKIESATQMVAAEEHRKTMLKGGKNVTGITLFSVLFPGMGQVCNGQYKKGLLVLFGTIIGLLLFLIPGLIVWLYGIYDAYSTAKKMDNGEIEFREPGSLVFIGFIVLWVIIVLGTVVLLLFGFQYAISHHPAAIPAVTAAATPAALPSAAVTAGPASTAGAPASQTLIILSATYGAAGKNKDVTEWLKTKIVNNAINTPVTNANIGSDPAYGLTKYLTVKYQYNGEERTANITERGILIIP